MGACGELSVKCTRPAASFTDLHRTSPPEWQVQVEVSGASRAPRRRCGGRTLRGRSQSPRTVRVRCRTGASARATGEVLVSDSLNTRSVSGTTRSMAANSAITVRKTLGTISPFRTTWISLVSASPPHTSSAPARLVRQAGLSFAHNINTYFRTRPSSAHNRITPPYLHFSIRWATEYCKPSTSIRLCPEYPRVMARSAQVNGSKLNNHIRARRIVQATHNTLDRRSRPWRG